eukprot:gene6041-2652_t
MRLTDAAGSTPLPATEPSPLQSDPPAEGSMDDDSDSENEGVQGLKESSPMVAETQTSCLDDGAAEVVDDATKSNSKDVSEPGLDNRSAATSLDRETTGSLATSSPLPAHDSETETARLSGQPDSKSMQHTSEPEVVENPKPATAANTTAAASAAHDPQADPSTSKPTKGGAPSRLVSSIRSFITPASAPEVTIAAGKKPVKPAKGGAPSRLVSSIRSFITPASAPEVTIAAGKKPVKGNSRLVSSIRSFITPALAPEVTIAAGKKPVKPAKGGGTTFLVISIRSVKALEQAKAAKAAEEAKAAEKAQTKAHAKDVAHAKEAAQSKDAAQPKDAAHAKDVGNAKAAVQSQPPRAPTPTENVPKDAAHSQDAALAKDAGHAEEVVQSQPPRVPTPTENGRSD